MGLFSDFYKNKKREYEHNKSFRQFVKMFGSVSHELGLTNASIGSDRIFPIFQEMGVVDNSADVFIQLVLILHTFPTSSGILILKQMGMMSVNGNNIEQIVNSLRHEEMDSVSRMIANLMPELREMFEQTDEILIKEPIRLLIGFYRHNEYLKEKAIFQEEDRESSKSAGSTSIVARMRGSDLGKPLEIYKSDHNQIGFTRVPIKQHDMVHEF